MDRNRSAQLLDALNGSVHSFGPSSTLSPQEASILAAHAHSQSNAVIYIVVVLLVYVLALGLLLFKYVRRERDEARLSYLYDEFVRRDQTSNKSPQVVHVTTVSPATGLAQPEPERFLVFQNVSPV